MTHIQWTLLRGTMALVLAIPFTYFVAVLAGSIAGSR